MSIVPLAKVTLFGTVRDKERVLEGLQRLGCMHLAPLVPPPEGFDPPARAEDAYRALAHISDVRHPRRPVLDPALFDLDRVVEDALANQQRLREAEDRRELLRRRLRELEPWGEFRFPPEDSLGGRYLWFYRIPHGRMDELVSLDLPWERVHRDNRFSYVVVIAVEEPPADRLPVPRARTGALSVSELRRALHGTEVSLEALEGEREALSRYRFLLARSLAYADDRAALLHAAARTLDRGGLTATRGWVPCRDLERLEAFARTEGLALLSEPPADGDLPPTLLDNPPALSGGQDLVGFYRTPAYRGWDPSVVVFGSFALFFAMILADAGYALLLAALLGLRWHWFEHTPARRRFRVLSITGLGLTLVYGVLAGSYLGLAPPPESWLGRAVLLDLSDFQSMMRVAILVGGLHVALANAAAAANATRTPDRLRATAWAVGVLAGVGGWLAAELDAPGWLANAAGVVLGASLAAVVAFASARPVTSLATGALRLLDGLTALLDVTRLFGDVLSYLRLFALGLASASLAMTFNQLAGQVSESVPGLGPVLAFTILVSGHGINLALAVVSGFVHGLRLNYIEFFNWGLADEGHPFRPFAKREVQP